MNPEYAIASYVIVFVTIIGYTLWLWRKQRTLENELVAIEAEEDAERRRS